MNQIALAPEHWTAAKVELRRPELLEPAPYRWTAARVLQLSEAGLFGDRRIELIDGEIFQMPDEGVLHQGLRQTLLNVWIRWLAVHADDLNLFVGTNGPIRLADDDEPEPDLYIYPAGLPLTDVHGPQSLLVVEIASTSHAHDFGRKVPRYARFGVPELWIIDAVKRVTVVHRGPDPDGTWASVTRHGEGETISPQALPGLNFRLADYPAPAEASAATDPA